jgi:hypothetical protein
LNKFITASHHSRFYLVVGICFIRFATSKALYSLLPQFQRSNYGTSSTIVHPMRPTPAKPSSYIEDGYNITLTDAPKDLGGRLRLNCARTTPELPDKGISINPSDCFDVQRTMWSSNLAPNNPDL